MMATVVYAAAFILYILTLSPTISVGDSPELISSAYTLGIAHPPGYPLFSLLGKGFAFIPFSNSAAYKVNLLSAFLGGASVFFLYLTTIELIGLVRMISRDFHSTPGTLESSNLSTIDHLSAFLGSLIFAVSPLFWSQAVVAEVYTLNAAFYTGLIWLGLKWMKVESGSSRLSYLIAFLWGLGLANHHTMIAFGPVFFLFVFLKGKDFSLPLLALAVAFFLLGLSVYLYLPIRSTRDPFMDWGDPEKLNGFLDVILRRQFDLGSRSYSIDRAVSQLAYYFNLLRRQYTLPGLLLGVTGMVFLFKRSSRSFFSLSLLFLVNGLFTVLILNPAPGDQYSIDVMVIPSVVVFSVWVGIGFLFIYNGVMAIFMKGMTVWRERAISLTLISAFLTIPSANFRQNLHENNQTKNSFAYDYARDMLEYIEPKGVLFVEADLSLFPVWYMQHVEGVRRDVAVLDVDMLMLPWFKAQLKEKYLTVEIKVPDVIRHARGGRFKPLSPEALETYKVSQVAGMLDGLMDKHSVYLSYEFGVPFREFGERKDIGLVKTGVVFRVSKERGPDLAVDGLYGLRSIMKELEARNEEVLFIARAYVTAMHRIASIEISSGSKEKAMDIMEALLTVDPYNTDSLNNLAFLYAEEEKNFKKAELMVKRAMRIKPAERGRYLKTLGFIYLKNGEHGKAIDVFKEVLKIEPASEWTRSRLEETYSKISPPLTGRD